MKKLSIFLLARSLDVGGTQRQLVLLAKGLHELGHSVAVGLFYSGDALVAELEGSGVEVVDLAKKGRWDSLGFGRRLIAEVRKRRADVLYSFLTAPNVIAAAVKPFLGETRVVWGIRASDMKVAQYGLVHQLARKTECLLSHVPERIISNSSAGAEFAIRSGFPRPRIAVVPNGIDTDRFRPDQGLRSRERKRLGIRDEEIAIGVLARLDRMKGYGEFLDAAVLIAARNPLTRFFCIGDGPEAEGLKKRTQELGLGDRVMFPGEMDAVAALNALDVACSSSLSEGFSNAVAEAMACGLPSVVTDVGDSASIVGRSGTVVAASSATALADGILLEIAKLARHDASLPRTRIVRQFSVAAMIEGTVEVLHSVLPNV